MDFDLKQWRNQEESEAKVPRLVLDLDSTTTTTTTATHGVGGGSGGSSSPALPLFVSEPPTSKLSAYSSDSTPTATTKIPRMGGSYFSLGQWQELELQALIFRHMISGAPVPPELLHLVKKSLFNSASPYYFPHPLQHYPHYHPAAPLMQAGYWGRGAMDPEPGRCRRTDGKKWRCSRDVVAGQKYCERHMHRGRNRSRKPVEIPTPTPSTAGGLKTNPTADAQPLSAMAGRDGAPHFTLSAAAPSSSIDLFHLNQRHAEPIGENHGPLEAQNDGHSGGQTLRHFFDDWPRPLHGNETASAVASATNLSISIPENASSDFSLKLSTGDGCNSAAGPQLGSSVERTAWGTNQVASMGGPLAEALRSSTSNSSPTSVLHQLQRNSTSETSFISS